MSIHEEDVLGKAYDARLMRRLITYLRPYKRYVVLALVLILFESSLEVTFPWLTKIAIDQYIKAANIAGLATIAVIYIVLLLVRFVCASGETSLRWPVARESSIKAISISGCPDTMAFWFAPGP